MNSYVLNTHKPDYLIDDANNITFKVSFYNKTTVFRFCINPVTASSYFHVHFSW